jgi:hypothetical protein
MVTAVQGRRGNFRLWVLGEGKNRDVEFICGTEGEWEMMQNMVQNTCTRVKKV